MGKLLSAKEAKLQKKLIPLNIVVCVICLAAILSLFFAPILKIDIGKIIRDEGTARIVEEQLDEAIGGSLEGTSQQSIDFVPVVSSVVKQVLGKVEGDITFSAYGFAKLAAAEGDSFELLMDDLLFSEKGLVNDLVDSIVGAVTGMFETEEGKAVIEQAVVTTVVSSIGNFSDAMPDEIKDKLNENLTPQKVTEISEIFYGLNDAENEDDVVEVVNQIFDEVKVIVGEEYAERLDEDAREGVTEVILELYNNTLDALENSDAENKDFSIEALICVAVSSNLDLGGIDIGGLLDDLLNGGSSDSGSDSHSPSRYAAKAAADDEVAPPAPPAEPSENEIVFTYTDLLGNMGLGEEDMQEISDKIKTVVRNLVDESVGGVKESLGGMGAVYDSIYLIILGVWTVLFILPWFILLLFAFFHIFAKNKRFTMWYVKMGGFIPALLSIALWVTPTLLTKFGMEQSVLDIANIVLGGISSFTWISGVCFVLLWLVSIFWAFPIKHKIRKERKACKRAKKAGTYSYDNYEEEFGHAVTESAADGSESYQPEAESYDDVSDDFGYDDDGFDDGGYDYSYNDDDEY